MDGLSAGPSGMSGSFGDAVPSGMDGPSPGLSGMRCSTTASSLTGMDGPFAGSSGRGDSTTGAGPQTWIAHLLVQLWLAHHAQLPH